MARTKKKDNSVVFIGEEDKEPLLKKGSNPKNSTPFPGSFIKYLFSEKSVLMRILSSLCPPFGRFKRIGKLKYLMCYYRLNKSNLEYL